MITSRSTVQRRLHTLVSGLCGRENSCSYEFSGVRRWKIDYRSQESAERAAVELSAKRRREFDVYQCWFCQGWHIGNAHNLTVGKFLRILWFWLLRKKRIGNKPRPYARTDAQG